MKSLITPALGFFMVHIWLFYFYRQSQNHNAHLKTEGEISGKLTVFLFSAVNIFTGKDEFFI